MIHHGRPLRVDEDAVGVALEDEAVSAGPVLCVGPRGRTVSNVNGAACADDGEQPARYYLLCSVLLSRCVALFGYAVFCSAILVPYLTVRDVFGPRCGLYGFALSF